MKLFATSSFVGAGLILFAALSPQTLLEKQASLLKEAKALKATYTVTHIGGSKDEYTLTYSRPDLLLVDGPDRLIESDGKTLWEYNKASKTYTETPVTQEMLATKAQADEVIAWAAFFVPDMMKKMSNLQAGASRVMKGNPVTEVTYTLAGTPPRTVTLFIDDKLGIARGLSAKTAKGDIVVMATELQVSADAFPAEKFAFAAPAGATKAVAPSVDVNSTGYASVRGILENNCLGCHGQNRPKGGYSVATYQKAVIAVTPGDPDNSQLVKYLTGDLQPRMPSGKGPLPAGDIDKIKEWIKAGAKE